MERRRTATYAIMTAWQLAGLAVARRALSRECAEGRPTGAMEQCEPARLAVIGDEGADTHGGVEALRKAKRVSYQRGGHSTGGTYPDLADGPFFLRRFVFRIKQFT